MRSRSGGAGVVEQQWWSRVEMQVLRQKREQEWYRRSGGVGVVEQAGEAGDAVREGATMVKQAAGPGVAGEGAEGRWRAARTQSLEETHRSA